MSEPTPTSSETSARPLITLAPEGDVILDISDSPATSDYNDHPHTQYLVASQVLCVASPVFRTMFSKTSPFEEAASLYDPTRTMPITVTLEDNPGAFEIVLDVLHLRNRHVERQLQLPTLLAIAKISDKYQLYEALMLVTDLWRTTIMNMDAALPEKVILAWAFRYEGLFRETTREILKQSFYVRRHRLVLVQGFSLTWLSECLPECLIGKHCEYP